MKDLGSLAHSEGNFAFQPNYVVLAFHKHAFLSPKDSAFHLNIRFNYCFCFVKFNPTYLHFSLNFNLGFQ